VFTQSDVDCYKPVHIVYINIIPYLTAIDNFKVKVAISHAFPTSSKNTWCNTYWTVIYSLNRRVRISLIACMVESIILHLVSLIIARNVCMCVCVRECMSA